MPASNIRLTLGHLFYVLFLAATATSLFGLLGLPIACFVGVIWWQVLSGARREAYAQQRVEAMPPMSRRNRRAMPAVECIAALLVVSLVIGLLIPAEDGQDSMQLAERSMKAVARAVREYEEENGVLPSVLYDSVGRPMHSWRALILEQLGEYKLAQAYRLDEPWDGPNNSQLLHYRPWHYRGHYPQQQIGEENTTLHLIGSGDAKIVVEHELQSVLWLQPDSMDYESVPIGSSLPALQQGFWNHGFFTSSHRGRLAVGEHTVFYLHPESGINPWQLATHSDTTAIERTCIGTPHTSIHVGTILRLVCFTLVALYPLKWLPNV